MFIEILQKCLSRKVLTLIIIIIIILIVHLFTADLLTKKFRKRGKIIYLHKSVSTDFFLTFKVLSKFQDSSGGRLNKTYIVNMFCMALRTIFFFFFFYFCLNVHKLNDSFAFIWKKIRCHSFLFLHHILPFGSSGLNCEFMCREYGFSINSKISFIWSGYSITES